MSRITQEQKNIINTFTCERLTEKEENKSLIVNFENERGRPLVEYLKTYAWQEDREGKTAFYIIKDSDNDVLMFFSLKCGSLFDPIDEASLKDRAKFGVQVIKLIDISRNGNDIERDKASKILEQLRSGQQISLEIIEEYSKSKVKKFSTLVQEKQQEKNEKIIRVNHTFPAVELVHFCINDLNKDKWKKLKLCHPFGEVMFWQFIAPLIYSTQKIIGCQYVYLFAADCSDNGNLTNYYNVSLKFDMPSEIATNKPSYDFCCEFMCQEINKLKENRFEYFENFNPNPDDIFV